MCSRRATWGTILLLCAAAQAGCRGPAPRVVIVSVDGLWSGDLARTDSAGVETPTLDSLRRAGAFGAAVGSYPSVTYPSHTTMISGVPPAIHGVYSNVRPYDPLDRTDSGAWYWEASWRQAPTLIDQAHAAGHRVAAIAWPVTADDTAIAYNMPERWDLRPGGTSQLEMMRRHGTPWLLDSLGIPATGNITDSIVATVAAGIIRRWDPELLLVHLLDVDGAKHSYGPVHDSAWAAIGRVDRRIGQVLSALRETHGRRPTTVIVTSDHGFRRYHRILRPGVLLARAGLVRLDRNGRVTDWSAAVLGNGGSMALITRHAGDTAVTRRLREAIPDSLIGPGRPIRAVLPPDTVALLGGDPRAAWFLDMNEGFYTRPGYTEPFIESRTGGGHGYDPRPPPMHAFFVMSGPGVPAGTVLGVINQMDIGPTAARALGVTLPGARGRALF
ncbi:MAG TPA: alkaline phosphatase family protein [Gemmatimonadales bacterium]|nr:alkaline phosphatase family protein [Gemmatimonadales bacterium]